MSDKIKPGDVRPGSVSALRKELERTLRKVAPFQWFFLRPVFKITHASPTVLVVRLVGMKNLTHKQVHALETVVEDVRAIGSVVILTFGSGRQ